MGKLMPPHGGSINLIVMVFLFCFVCLATLSVPVVGHWWHDYHRDDFPTLKFGVVMADLLTIR